MRGLQSSRGALLLSTLLVLCLVTSAAAEPLTKSGELIVKFKAGASQSTKDSILADIHATRIRRFDRIRAEHDRVTGATTVAQAIARYRNHPAVEFIEPNYVVSIVRTPNDPLFPQLWGLRNTGQTGGLPGADISAVEAWNTTTGSPNVVVAIIDTGVDYGHPDLAGNIYSNAGEIPGNGIDDDGNGYVDDVRGWDFVNFDNNPMDDHGHGTHTAGTVGAVGDNGIGVVGVSWSVRLMPLKFLDSSGNGTTAGAIAAIEYATLMGVDVMSNSWGGGDFSEALRLAIQDASNAGILFVAAAGNSSSNNDVFPFYPASYDVSNVIAVASTDHFDNLSDFSSFGATSVDLAAPGTAILSTVPGGGYAQASGTSMATPHVSGVLALILARFPEIAMSDAKALVLNSVDPLPSLSGLMLTGGRLNAVRALEGPDSIAPDPILDLAALGPASNSVPLQWTATGDDGANGIASAYDIRSATFVIDEANFDTATRSLPAPTPLPAGSLDQAVVSGLNSSTTYYFAVRILDEYGNRSSISNVVSATTLGPPDIDVSPTTLSAALLTGGTATQTLTLRNLAAGTLDFSFDVDFSAAAGPGVPPPPGDSLGGGSGLQWSDYVQAAAADSMPAPLYPAGGAVTLTLPTVITDPTGDGGLVDLIALRGLSDRGNLQIEMELATVINRFNFGGFLSLDVDRNRATGYPPSFGNPGQDIGAEYEFQFFNLQTGFVTLYQLRSFVGSFPVEIGERTLRFSVPLAFLGNDDGTMDVTGVIGDGFGPTDWFPNTGHGSIFGIRWLSVNPSTGTVPPGESLAVQVTFDAGGLFGGGYDASVRIASNDPDEAVVVVPAHLDVTGAPDISVSSPTLSYGPVFLGYSRPDTVVVTNAGTDLLTVTSVTASPGDYTLPLGGFTLAPGASHELIVTFSPQSVGVIAGSLTIASDDPDEGSVTVTLTGEGLIAPDVEVAPASLSADLLTGETTTRQLTVRNTGGSNLTFTVAQRATVVPPAQAGTITSLPGTAPPGSSPPPSPQSSILVGNDILVLSTTPISNSLVRALQELRHSYDILFTQDFTGIDFTPYRTIVVGMSGGQISEASCQALANAAADGRLLFMVGGTNWAPFYSGVQTYLLSHTGETGWTTSATPHLAVMNAADPLANGLPSTYTFNQYQASYYMLRINDAAAPVAVRNGDNHPALVHKSLGAGTLVYFINSADDFFWANPTDFAILKQIVQNALVFGPARWLSVVPDAGTVPAGGEVTLQVSFDAAGLNGGDYQADVHIASNDPDEADVAVPANLHVTGAPDISLSTLALSYGPVFVGGSRPDTVVVTNAGTDLLTVTSVTASPGDYAAPAGGFSLAPGASRDLIVTFSPQSVGVIAGSLTIASNDPDEGLVTVTLAGEGLIAPDVEVAPASLSADLLTGETATRQLTVRNTGGSNLNFSVAQRAAVVPPAQAATITSVPGSASPGTGPPPTPQNSILVGNDILVLSTTFISNSLERALQELGRSYDLMFTENFTGIDFTPYRTIVVGMDGGLINEASCQALANAAAGGRLLFMVGGTNWTPFYAGVQAHLLSHTGEAGWTISAPPHLTVTNASDPLANGLPSAYTFNEVGASYYMLRVNDAAAPVAVRNGDNHPALVHKSLGAGTLVYYINSAYGGYWTNPADFAILKQIVQNALTFGSAPWLSVEPNAGTVPAGGEATLQVGFNAAGLNGGDYQADIHIVSNDPDEADVAVPANLHVTGIPIIAVSPASLDFGSLFVNQSAMRTLRVANTGSDLLSVSGISIDEVSYSPNLGAFDLVAGAFRDVTVNFAPTSPGLKNATLSITHNAAGSPTTVSLTGAALLPPVLTLSPDSILVSLNSGETRTDVLTIGNAGVSDLHFSLSAIQAGASVTVNNDPPLAKGEVDPRVGSPAIQSTGGPDQFGHRWVDSDEPGGPAFNWVDISPIGSSIPITGDDVTSNPIPIGFSFRYYGAEFTTARVSTNGFLSFTSSSADYSNQPLPSTFAPENMVAAFWDDLYFVPESRAYYHSDGTRFIVQFDNVSHYGGGGPYTFQIILKSTGVIEYQYLSMAPPLTDATIGIQNGAMNDGLTVVFNNNYVHNNLAVRFSAVPQWLTLSPTAGTVPPEATLPVEATLNATGLPPGHYRAQIEVSTNDPVAPLRTVPVALHVIGVPLISVSPPSLAFGSLFVGQSDSLSLRVENVGTDLLSVSGISVDEASYRANPTAFDLAPGSSRSVEVTFAPLSPGTKNATLLIDHNAAGSPTSIPLTATALLPPDISVSPPSMSAALLTGQCETQTLTIGNSGVSDLEVEISTRASAVQGGAGPGPGPGAGGAGAGDSRTSATTAPVAARAAANDSSVLVIQDTSAFGEDMDAFLVSQFGITPTVIHSTQITTTDFSPYRLIITVGDENSSYYQAISANVAKFETFLAQGGVVQYQLATTGASVQIAGGAQVLWGNFEYQNRVLLPDHPIVAGLPQILDGNYINLSYLTQLPPDAQIITETAFSHVPTTVEYSVGAGTVVATGMTWEYLSHTEFNSRPLLYQATAYSLSRGRVSWLSVTPTTATIPAGGSLDVQVTFCATGLFGGDYDAEIRVASNDPDEAVVVVPAHLDVTGVPLIAVSPSSLDFGSLFVNQSVSRALVVENTGTDVLSVSRISVDEASYSANPGAFNLAPDGSQTVVVTFAPSTPGPKDATLSITHNAAGSPTAVPLSGTALLPPIITLAPDSIDARVRPGEVRTETLTIGNSGASDLHFSLDPRLAGASVTVNHDPPLAKGVADPRTGSPVIQRTGGPDQFGHRWIDSDHTGGPTFNWVDISSIGTAIPITGDDAISAAIPIGFPFRYYGAEFATARVCTNGFLSFTSSSPAYSNQPLPSSVSPENLVAAFWDDLNFVPSSNAYYHSDGARFIVQFDTVYHIAGGGPYTFEIILYPTGVIVYQYLTMASPLTDATIGIQNGARDDGLTVVFNNNYVHNNLALRFDAAPPWLTLNPTAGTVPAGATLPVGVTLNSTGLSTGEYRGAIGVSSNDPATPLATIPVAMQVVDDSPPVVVAPGTANGAEAALLEVGVTASDPDGDMMFSLTADHLPQGATFVANATNSAGELRWTPDFDQAGIYEVTIAAASSRRAVPVSSPADLLEGFATIQLMIANTDRAPVVTAPAERTVAEGVLLTFSISASDPDGDPVASLEVGEIPVGAVYTPDPAQPAGAFAWTPTYEAAGVYPVTFTASNALSGSATTTITVTNLNRPPVADAGGPYTGVAGVPITFDGTGSFDPDGQQLQSVWDFGDGATGVGATPMHTYAAAGDYNVTLRVTEPGGLYDEGATTATVRLEIPVVVILKNNGTVLDARKATKKAKIAVEQAGFQYTNILANTLRLTTDYPNSGSVTECAAEAKGGTGTIGDVNLNGTPDYLVSFLGSCVKNLFNNTPDNSTVNVIVTGEFATSSGTALLRGVKVATVRTGGAGAAPIVASAYPNPFNPETVISYSVRGDGAVTVRIYSVDGRLVRTLKWNEATTAGSYDVTWNGTNDRGLQVSSGVYLVRTTQKTGAGERSSIIKVAVTK